MPKKRQIPFLRHRTLADGSRQFDWKPSNALRAAGWNHVTLGSNEADAVREALEINARVAAWRAGQGKADAGPKRDDAPRLVRWDGLVARYRRSTDYAGLKPKTRTNYESAIRALTSWAQDGRLIIRQIDYDMVQDLKRSLERGGSSDHRTANLLRVLRLLLGFAERERIIPRGTNPAREARIREPRARRHVLSLEAVELLAATADAEGHANLSLAILLGFWTVQRQGDLLANFNRLAWRELNGIEARDAALLKGPTGKVMGFRHMPGKTAGSSGVWIDAPVPPFLHPAIEAAWDKPALKGGTLLRDDMDDAAALVDWRLQRLWRDLRTRTAARLRAEGRLLLAAEIEPAQFRDLRRSGQVYMRDAGAKKEWITSLSGHTLLARKSILDTYMPADTAAACAAMACALRLRNRQKKERAG